MSSNTLIALAVIASTIVAYYAAKLARKQDRNVIVWAAACFVLPALLLILMKFEVDRQKQPPAT